MSFTYKNSLGEITNYKLVDIYYFAYHWFDAWTQSFSVLSILLGFTNKTFI